MDAAQLRQLQQIPICRGLTEAEVAAVFGLAEEVSKRPGDYLFREGDPGTDGLYVVLEGTMEITKKDRAATEQQLARVGDGSAVGEMSLINGASPRSASVRAATGARLLRVPAERFSALLKSDSVAALKIVSNLAQVMSRRLLMMDEKLVDLLDKAKRKQELADFQKILTDWSF